MSIRIYSGALVLGSQEQLFVVFSVICAFIAILRQIRRLLQVISEIADAQLGSPAARSLDGGDSSPKGSEITAACDIYPYVG
jgi:hypothetical protein